MISNQFVRLFYGLDLPTNVTQSLSHWCNQQSELAKFKAVRPSNYHITLVFLGMVAQGDIAQLIQLTNSLKLSTFTIKTTELGLFSKPQALYLATELPDTLHTIVKQLQQLALHQRIKIEQRAYLPHITICRKANALPQIALQPEKASWPVKQFHLYQSVSTSEGVQYKIIHSWPLADRPTSK